MKTRQFTLVKSVIPCYCGFVIAHTMTVNSDISNTLVMVVTCFIILMFAVLADISFLRWVVCSCLYLGGILLCTGDAFRAGLRGSLLLLDVPITVGVTLCFGGLSWFFRRLRGIFKKDSEG